MSRFVKIWNENKSKRDHSRGKDSPKIAQKSSAEGDTTQGPAVTGGVADIADAKLTSKGIGHDVPRTAMKTRNKMYNLVNDPTRLQQVEVMYEKSLKDQETQLGTDHPETLITVMNLGVVYSDQGRFEDAAVMYQRALDAQEKHLGKEHPDTLFAVNSLGITFHAQGRLTEAEAMLERALAGKEKRLGSEDLETIRTVRNLGVLYADQGRLEEGEKMLERASQSEHRRLGATHPQTLRTLDDLAGIYTSLKRYPEAEKLYEQGLAAKEKVLGQDHVDTLWTVQHLAHLRKCQGRLAEAENLYTRAFRGYEKHLGPQHPGTIDMSTKIANLYQGLARYGNPDKMSARQMMDDRPVFYLDRENQDALIVELKKSSITDETHKSLEPQFSDPSEAFVRDIRIADADWNYVLAAALLDTQCHTGNWISRRLVERLGKLPELRQDFVRPELKDASGKYVEVSGEVTLDWKWSPKGTRVHQCKFFVFPRSEHLDVIFGVEYIVAEGLITIEEGVMVPLTAHKKMKPEEKAAVALAEEQQRQQKAALEAKRSQIQQPQQQQQGSARQDQQQQNV